jgi:hypothetical protein
MLPFDIYVLDASEAVCTMKAGVDVYLVVPYSLDFK